jgi:hypothetical protein
MHSASLNHEQVALAIIHGTLTNKQFAQFCTKAWDSGDFVFRLSHNMRETLFAKLHDAPIANVSSDYPVNFTLVELCDEKGKVGGIHISAKQGIHDLSVRPDFSSLERPPHFHGKHHIGFVTQGQAIFYANRKIGEERECVVSAHVALGDMLFWPRGVIHTFDYSGAFSLLNMMNNYTGVEGSGYSLQREHYFDDLPLLPYSHLAAAIANQAAR